MLLTLKIYYFPNNPIDLPESDKALIRMFGIIPGSNEALAVNTGFTRRYVSVADNVDNFDVYDINENNKTFGYVYITFDNSYFNLD